MRIDLHCHYVHPEAGVLASAINPVLKEHAYFVTSSKPATVLRCPLHDMFHGDTFHPVEVTLALGEHQFSQKKSFPIRGVYIVNIVGH
jgi:hypothetical protein